VRENGIAMEDNCKKFCTLVHRIVGKDNVSTFIELGSRDCVNTVGIAEYFPNSKVIAFECNPETLDICRINIKGYSRISLIEKAVSEVDGWLDFYAVDTELSEKTNWKDGNPGASSIFKIDHTAYQENIKQKKITVPSTRLDTFLNDANIGDVDALYMDIQGAELTALKSMGSKVENVKVIQTEVAFSRLYEGQPLFTELSKYLHDRGFVLSRFTNFSGMFGDAVFVNKKILKGSLAYYFQMFMGYILSYIYSKLLHSAYRCYYQPIKRFKMLNPSFLHRLLSRPFFIIRRKFLFMLEYFLPAPADTYEEELIDVVIPCVEKDLDTLPLTVSSIRENILHRVNQIIIVAPNIPAIVDFCVKNDCVFLDEQNILSEMKPVAYSICGKDRSGWLFQQYIKLFTNISSTPHYLVVDADTVFLQPKALIKKGKYIFDYSDDHFPPYYTFFRNLFRSPAICTKSFICHYMLFNKEFVSKMLTEIERIGNKPWYRVITNEIQDPKKGVFSEYITYANWLLLNYPEKIITRYWYGLQKRKKHLRDFQRIRGKLSRIYKSVSFQSY